MNKKSIIQIIGEKLPNINTIFIILTIIVLICSYLLSGTYFFEGLKAVEVKNLLSVDGFRWFIQNVQQNFISFAPLALALIAVIGTGVAEKTGLLGALVKKVGLNISENFLIPMLMFLGIMSSIASDVGYIILVPLAGYLYASLNKNPILGILIAFAGVSAGFGANLLPTPGDALLGGLTLDAMKEANISGFFGIATMNLYFMIASTFLLMFVGWFITVKFIEPKFENRKFELPDDLKNQEVNVLTKEEEKGLKYALFSFLVLIVIIVFLYFSKFLTFYADSHGNYIQSFLDNAINITTGGKNPKVINLLLDNMMIFMVLAFLVPGYAYGVASKKIKTTNDYMNYTIEGIKDNASIILIAFFAGNFITIFNYSGLGQYIASNGAILIQNLGLDNYPIILLIGFILLTAFINLFMGSASAKWAILSPIFIPLLYSVNNNLTPDIVQAAYRVADSSTNIISPLMTYTPIVLMYIQKFDKSFNLGDLIRHMSKYSIGFLISWTMLLMIFYLLKIPFGF